MTISNIQINTLAQAYYNDGYFQHDMSSLGTGLLNKVIEALQSKALLALETSRGYPITETGKAVVLGKLKPNNIQK